MEIASSTLNAFQGPFRSISGRGGRDAGEPGEQSSTKAGKGGSEEQVSAQEKAEIRKLQSRDREVRAHELAHLAAGGGVVRGGATYQYARGPDGRLYAVGGEVAISGSGVQGNPQATLQKAETIRRAALAPAKPSSQDLQVASSASLMAANARAEIRAEVREEQAEAAERISGEDSLQKKLAKSGAVESEEQATSLDAFV
ncbi:MAG: putative metalloprotease CJM1_0395 family protein [Candidatus Sedimenticola sp. 20ELBAFRAG]